MPSTREKGVPPGSSHSFSGTQPHQSEKKYNRTPSDAISYEDLLVAQYLEGLKRAESKKKLNRPSSKSSPYLQKMEHADLVTSRSSTITLPKGNRRPASAVVAGRNNSREKKRIDAKYIADAGKFLSLLEEHEAEEDERRKMKGMRPQSAPVYKTNKRPWSAKSGVSTATSIRSYRSKHQYKQQPTVIRAIAYKNGTQNDGVKITCPTVKIFLETCTLKLGLKFAARRMFLGDGQEIRTADEIPKDGEVYISQGEPFRDPLRPVQGTAHKKLHAAWTMNGIVLPQEPKKKMRPALSKRMRKMLATNTRRIMVFQNGDGMEVCETLATLDNFDKFLDDCTLRLGLNSSAKVVYTWDKQQITHISDIEMLEQCLQTSTTPVYGPVWISQGENFRASGVADFLTTLMKYCKQKLREAKQYKAQLNMALNDDTQRVTMVAILSKSKEEQKKDLEETEEGIYEFTEVKDKLQALLDDVAEDAAVEKESGSNYTMKHIKEMDLSHRLVGQKGLRLKVYENGTNEGETIVFFNLKDASKGIGHDRTLLLQRLFDVISGTVQLEKNTTALSTVVTKIFDKNGTEINDVYALKYDQEIWISFGEEFRDPYVYCMQLSLDTVSASSYFGEYNVAIREALTSDSGPNIEQHTHWDPSIGFPVIYNFNELNETSRIDELDRFFDSIKNSRIDVNGHFLQHKDDASVVLYPEVAIGIKKKQGDKDVYPTRAQAWVINKRGQIYCRAMPQLALTVIHKWKIDTLFVDGKTPAQGYAIGLERRATGNSFQEWSFSADGYIHSVAEPNLVMTYIQEKSDDTGDMSMEQMMSDGFTTNGYDDSGMMNGDEDAQLMSGSPEDVLKMKIMKQIEGDKYGGQKLLVAAVPKLSPRHAWAKSQRWALKQERLDNLGQWKHTKAQNPQWNKLAYSWPVLEDGNWNDGYDWPMEGFLIPYAPPIRKLSKTTGDKNQEESKPFRNHPLRLRVMKNGERDMQKSVQVIPPDMTNMIRDLHRTAMNGKRPHKRSKSRDVELTDSMDFSMLDAAQREKFLAKQGTIMELEFKLFMDRCTSALNLPFAARRIFSHKGTEYTALDDIERDQLVFVSCGEAFADPNLSSQEQQRRMLLATLAGDIDAIRQYVFLREPGDVVLEVDGSLGVGSSLVVNTCAMTMEERHSSSRGQSSLDGDDNDMEQDGGDPLTSMSAHEKAHAKSEHRHEGLKWPWEKVLNVGLDEVTEVNQEGDADEGYTNMELYKKFRPKQRKSPRSNRLNHQRFMLMDGFLVVKSIPFLVVGVENDGAEGSSAVVCKKNVEDVTQRWEVDEQGFIHSKGNPDLVLGVSMPTFRPGDESITTSYAGQPITLQKKRSGNGSANQVWLIEKEGEGFIHAFGSTQDHVSNNEITAANYAGVCTYAVCGEQPTQQPGYVVTETKSSVVCPSCARAMRGTYKMQKLERTTPFVCAVGTASQKGLKLIGCFQCLNGKVDLSTVEAPHTLSHYEKELKRLRQMSNARIIAREISAYQPVQSIRVKAYKNGDGRNMEGVIVIGSTIRGILDQCTYQLQLSSAARRIYTQDGTLILSIGDLVKWTITNYGLENLTLGQDQKQEGKHHSRSNSAEVRISSAHTSILTMPVEVWISCGEQFVSPGYVDYKRALHNQQREERAKVHLELEKEKHVLRQMQGRRTTGLEGPSYKTTMSPDAPVLVEGGWTQPGMGEVRKSLQVHQLEHHLEEVKAHQRQQTKQTTKAVVDSNKKLYSQPNMKRLLVYKTGDKPENAVYAWGSSLSEVLHDSSLRLHLARQASYLFTTKGDRVESFDDLQRDQVLCASLGTGYYKGPKGSRSQVEIKATWSRARKKDCPLATNIMISPNKHPAVEVDPFGPPALALPAPPGPDA